LLLLLNRGEINRTKCDTIHKTKTIDIMKIQVATILALVLLQGTAAAVTAVSPNGALVLADDGASFSFRRWLGLNSVSRYLRGDIEAEEAADRDLKEKKKQRHRHRGHETPPKKKEGGRDLVDNQTEEAADRDLKEKKQQRHRHRGHETPPKKNDGGRDLVDNQAEEVTDRDLKEKKQQRRRHGDHETPAKKKNDGGRDLVDNQAE
jgi:hypothetical protein